MAVEFLSESEIAHRLSVWTALSCLFLDQELQAGDYRHIAAVVDQSGYSPAEVEEILRNEVAPAFVANLWSVAGEWQGWPEDCVRERVLEKRGSTFAKAGNRLLNNDFLTSEWATVAALLDR